MTSASPSNPWRYPTLLDAPDAIRLVVLLPAIDKRVEIECILRNSRLSNNPDYEALSYVWGDPHNTKQIILSDKKFNVTPTLEAALRRLRHSSKPRLLWIDALCIDQGNVSERISQVQQMGAIYRSAREVAVWLGPESNTSLRAFEILDAIVAILREKSWESLPFDHNAPDWLGEDYHDRRKADRQMCIYCSFFEDRKWGLGMEAIEKLLRRPWWQRVWVIQEIALAQEATLYCGRHSANWDAFDEFLQMVSKATSEKESFHAKPMMTENWLDKIHNRLSGLLPGVMMSNIRQWRNQVQEDSSPEPELMEILNLCRGTMCSDPRDRVYGVLDIFPGTKSNHPLVLPDYTISVTKLYSTVTVEKLLRDRTLDTLFMIAPNRLEFLENQSTGSICRDYFLPSWTPDWGVPGHPSIQEVKSRAEGDNEISPKYCAALDRLTPIPYELSLSGLILAIYGVEVDIISEVSPSRCKSRSFEAIDDWKIMADASNDIMYFGGKSRAEAFWLTITRSVEANSKNLFEPEESTRDSPPATAKSTEQERPGEARDTRRRFPPKSAADERHVKAWLALGPYHMTRKTFFRTQRGYLGTSTYMGPSYPDISAGDKVVVLLGGKVPVILRCDGTCYKLISLR
jgi:hypothetical protein